MARCSPNVIEGKEIKTLLDTELGGLSANRTITRKVPGPRSGGRCWLWGDLFGPDVARAFRAAGIPKKSHLVVEESVAELICRGVLANRDPDDDDGGGVSNGLDFGRRVAFSPIKGMDDLYDVWRYRIDKAGERRHVWLRTVASAPKGREAKDGIVNRRDPLSERQQQIRVFTELVTSENQEHVDKWIEILGDIENGAKYFRFVGRVKKAASWSWNEKKKMLIPDRPNRERSSTVVVLGAYPEFDTYFNIREGILENEAAFALHYPLSYAATHLLWEPRQLADKVLWPRAKSGEWFFVLLAAPLPDDVVTDPRCFSRSSWHNMIVNLSVKDFEHCDHGIVMGEWNYYAIFRGASESRGKLNWKVIAAACKRRLTRVRRLRFYGCQAETTHVTRNHSSDLPATV